MPAIHTCQQIHDFNETRASDIKIITARYLNNQHYWVLQLPLEYPETIHRVTIDYCPFCGAKLEETI